MIVADITILYYSYEYFGKPALWDKRKKSSDL